ncbi:MAG: acetylornithine transaminase [Bdellovibrionales bacterium]|nr:acetylornithine transaminase [Bdellovibrionales bacterium]
MMEAASPFLNTYKRFPVTFLRGEGVHLFDTAGKEYLDLLAGIAVVSIGHAHPKLAKAIATQASQLIHTSNLFSNEPNIQLAAKLTSLVDGTFRVFFSNSGTEAIECAIKFARKAAAGKRSTVVCAERSFHGRTLAALAATGQPQKWKGFEPLPAGFVHARFNDLKHFEESIDDSTCAVLLEPIQGEGGVYPATLEFLAGIRKLCDERGALLLFDEIQSGCGRTGSWFSWQQLGARPDVFVTAKGLGGGFPIGCCLVSHELSHHFQPGDHGSTFGGGPLASAAALTVLSVIEEEGLLENSKEIGALLAEELQSLPHVLEVRGRGLMLGVQLDSDIAAQVTTQALEMGVIINAVASSTLRITPPLCLSEKDALHGVSVLGDILSNIQG